MKSIKNKRGYTLLELLVVVLIIGILAAMAYPYYSRAIERSRIMDMLVLLGTERASQERYKLTKHHFTRYWHNLDAAPFRVSPPGTDNDYFNADRTEFYTRGGFLSQKFWPSYKVYFDQKEGDHWFLVAERIGWGGYDYTFVRSFDDTLAICVPNPDHADSVTLCTDFMGVDSLDKLPGDPREGL